MDIPPTGMARYPPVGNLFDWRVLGQAEAARLYEKDLLADKLPFTVADVCRELRGIPLGCHRPLDEPCHVERTA
jgi:hypothetical protein